VAKEEHYQVQGKVMQALAKHLKFRVNWTTAMKSSPTSPADGAPNNFIRILPGDIVTVAISPYDLNKGGITYRGPLKQATQEATEPRSNRRRHPAPEGAALRPSPVSLRFLQMSVVSGRQPQALLSSTDHRPPRDSPCQFTTKMPLRPGNLGPDHTPASACAARSAKDRSASPTPMRPWSPSWMTRNQPTKSFPEDALSASPGRGESRTLAHEGA